ncbi:hypothetical protein IQ279_01585 [Streptomyces verrucosisporus]|uniref:hypothetical protein n=1 Tax=Streptomyces verrucosisporus TaxID=1695161 RepID=UPI0019D301C9|nr:hypothetical protein [Streptomyces verrucosisporus]MBN3928349.1 hypothetical protein [Streptomyces verrucosisporus]
MGWTLLYIAFGIVAVWLLAEVLLQYKARLRWRLLAFGGFAMVVLGVVAISSVPLSLTVIALGGSAFTVGQTFVTLSYRRGFTAGWALGGMPGTSRRRREVRPMPPQDADPHLEVSGLEVHEPEPPAYSPEPLPDDTGGYGVYERGASTGQPEERYDEQGRYEEQGQYGGQERYEEQGQHPAHSVPYTTGDYTGHPGHDQGGRYAGSYDYGYGSGDGQQQYAAYSDPYADAFGRPAHDSHSGQGNQSGQGYVSAPSYADGYGTGHPADPYAGQTPPGGVWVPQQRGSEPQPGQYAEDAEDGGYGGYGYGEGGYDPAAGAAHPYGEQPRH